MKYKFRGFNKKTKTMVYLDPLQWPLNAIEDEENWKVMMWTGLLDRHGKEIYEGDVVRHDNPAYFNGTESEDTIRLHRGGTAQVISVPFEFEFKEIDCGEWRFNGPEGREWEQFSIEVIGDIYNNPELLR